MQRQSLCKIHLKTISNGELSDPLCDSVNRGLTLVRFCTLFSPLSQFQMYKVVDGWIMKRHFNQLQAQFNFLLTKMLKIRLEAEEDQKKISLPSFRRKRKLMLLTSKKKITTDLDTRFHAKRFLEISLFVQRWHYRLSPLGY